MRISKAKADKARELFAVIRSHQRATDDAARNLAKLMGAKLGGEIDLNGPLFHEALGGEASFESAMKQEGVTWQK